MAARSAHSFATVSPAIAMANGEARLLARTTERVRGVHGANVRRVESGEAGLRGDMVLTAPAGRTTAAPGRAA